jgi:hypothetical protein
MSTRLHGERVQAGREVRALEEREAPGEVGARARVREQQGRRAARRRCEARDTAAGALHVGGARAAVEGRGAIRAQEPGARARRAGRRACPGPGVTAQSAARAAEGLPRLDSVVIVAAGGACARGRGAARGRSGRKAVCPSALSGSAGAPRARREGAERGAHGGRGPRHENGCRCRRWGRARARALVRTQARRWVPSGWGDDYACRASSAVTYMV